MGTEGDALMSSALRVGMSRESVRPNFESISKLMRSSATKYERGLCFLHLLEDV